MRATVLGLRFMWHRPVLAVVFTAATLAQGALQGWLVWALRHVLLSFTELGSVGTMTVLWSGALVFGVWLARALGQYAAELTQIRIAVGVQVDSAFRVLEKLTGNQI